MLHSIKKFIESVLQLFTHPKTGTENSGCGSVNHKKSSSKSKNPARNAKTEKTGKHTGKNAALPDKKEHKKDKAKSGNNNSAGKQAKTIPDKVVPPMPEIIPVPQ